MHTSMGGAGAEHLVKGSPAPTRAAHQPTGALQHPHTLRTNQLTGPLQYPPTHAERQLTGPLQRPRTCTSSLISSNTVAWVEVGLNTRSNWKFCLTGPPGTSPRGCVCE